MIHAILDAGALKGDVAVPRPGFAPAFQNLDLVPVAVFGGEALGANLAGGQQNVGMVIAIIAIAPWRVQGDIRDHATVHELFLGEVPDQLDTLRMGQLGRQGHAHLAGDLAVLPGLGFLDAVPQLGSVAAPIRCMIRGEDFGVIDTAPRRVIEGQPGTAVFDALRHTIGDSRRGAAALTAGNHRSSEMIDRHSVLHFA